MQGILSPYLWNFSLVYIDDIVVYLKSYEDHIKHLDQVLQAVEESGITLSLSKCHFFYSSILLLGHKVSHLGLSTHEEKVKAILELERPTKISELQTFLGMLVYFQAFIPYFADQMGPLFDNLRKGTPWKWEDQHKHAWMSGKMALQESPVLGHAQKGLPYRLYTDASDSVCRCTLQQIQQIKISDLKGTKMYTLLEKAWKERTPMPILYNKLGTNGLENIYHQEWADDWEGMIMWTECVIGYYLRHFRGLETRYSATEREALAAKEGLIHFQPFIEGEKVTLITDHAVLQWAHTYENSN